MTINRVQFVENVPATSGHFSIEENTKPFNVLKNDIVVACISCWDLPDVPTIDFEYLDSGTYHSITKSVEKLLTGRLHLLVGMFVAPRDITGCVVRGKNTVSPLSKAAAWSSSVAVYRSSANSTLEQSQVVIGTAAYATKINNVTPHVTTTGPSTILLFNRTYQIQSTYPPTVTGGYTALSTPNAFDCVYEKVSPTAITNESPEFTFSDYVHSITAGIVLYEKALAPSFSQADGVIAKGIARGFERGIV
jgi:hypothetical protein